MALTVVSWVNQNSGSEAKKEIIVSADNSYPTNGYSLSAASIGLASITRVDVGESGGYIISPSYQSDPSTVKLVFKRTAGATPAGTISAPSLQTSVDEVISVTAGTGVSAAVTNIPVGIVQNVYVTAGGVTGAATIIPTAATLATRLVKVNLTTGVFTFLVADAVTSATVTYVRAAATVPTFTGTAIAAGGLVEVSNGTNLSALTSIKLTVYGY